ncbi:hypothetical protein RF55_8601 [Lasius niger]|uniref:Uncharacterized protein n=1 Tax=Lasius niger TaxID=67767 RepID=A0A0J7KMN9_LASNI|nr:hypothetical protein RF55_8601 [Lasius niger]
MGEGLRYAQSAHPRRDRDYQYVARLEEPEMEATQCSQRAESVAKAAEVEPTQPAEESLPTLAEEGVAAEEPGNEEGRAEKTKACDETQAE